jgi:hypothetical protein
MPKTIPLPTLAYLKAASLPALQGFELSRLGRAAALRRQIHDLTTEFLEESSAALLARWLMNARAPRRKLLRPHGRRPPTQSGSLELRGDRRMSRPKSLQTSGKRLARTPLRAPTGRDALRPRGTIKRSQ